MVFDNRVLRVGTYNIHKGFSAANRRPIIQQLRHAIRTLDADLFFLQEVVGESLKAQSWSFRDSDKSTQFTYPQLEYLADEIWPHHAYGRNAIYQKGHHGNAILSKSPFLKVDNVDVSQWWFSQRGILYGKLSVGVNVVCVHFGLFSWERKKQLEMLKKLLEDKIPKKAPTIIAGDFNDWNSSLHRSLVGDLSFDEAYTNIYGKPAKTFPARVPIFPMDRIYYRNLNLLDAEVLSGPPWNRLSDHRALYASFSLDK